MTFLKKLKQKKYESSLFPLNQLSMSILGFNKNRKLIFVSPYLLQKIGNTAMRPGMPLAEVLQTLKGLIYTEDADMLIGKLQNDPQWDPADTQIRYSAGNRTYISTISSDVIQDPKSRSTVRLYYLKEKSELFRPSEREEILTESEKRRPKQDDRIPLGERLRLSLSSPQQLEKQSAVILLSVDHFNPLSTSLSAAEAVKLNTVILERLKGLQNNLDITSSGWKEGHYSLIYPAIDSLSELKRKLNRIRSVLNQPFTLNKRVLTLHGSMGISFHSNKTDRVERPIQQAEMALTVARKRGGDQFVIYSQELKEGPFRQHIILQNLPQACKRGELFLLYQPRIDSSGNFVGVESLLRWHHPELGIIPPQEFIPLAESSGDIIDLGQWVLAEACKQARIWMVKGIDLTISVNISPVQIHKPDSCTMIRNILHKTALPPEKLELEVTETSLLNLLDKTLQSLIYLHDLGIRISLDDFGTGFSSLSYLGTFPVDNLKIDRSFIQDIHINANHRSVVQTIAALAKNFRYKIIAEGVETEEQLNILKEIGCDEFQGFYYHKPLRANEIEELYSTLSSNQKIRCK